MTSGSSSCWITMAAPLPRRRCRRRRLGPRRTRRARPGDHTASRPETRRPVRRRLGLAVPVRAAGVIAQEDAVTVADAHDREVDDLIVAAAAHGEAAVARGLV